jgi:hypothetical protein
VHSNRRSSPRVSRMLPIRYVGQGASVQSGEAVDISASGARLLLDAPADELTVEFEGQLAVLARTVWQQELPDGKQLVGVVFEGLHWGLRRALDDYVDRLAA